MGKLQVPDKYCAPDELLQKHIGESLSENAFDLARWSTISISGPPGSGKTELANLIAEKIKKNLGTIILMATTPQLLGEIDRFLKYQSTEEAFQSLVNTILRSPREDCLIPEIFEGDIWLRAFQDAFYDILRNQKHSLVIFVDDLHAYSSIHATILRLRQQFARLGLRFVLIGRTEVQAIPQEQFISVHCDLWNRGQSIKILEDWLPNKRKDEIESILERNWRKEQGSFSLYLLRIIAKHVHIGNYSRDFRSHATL